MDFSREKNGYSTFQVENYIENLKHEYEQTLGEQKIRISDLKRELETCNAELNKFKQKNNEISSALVVAVETAKQIELSSKNVYELEIKKIKNLYSKWQNLFDDILKDYPSLKSKYDTQAMLEKFSHQIDQVIQENGVSLEPSKNPEPVGIRNLISKMGGLTSKQVKQEQPKVEQTLEQNTKPQFKIVSNDVDEDYKPSSEHSQPQMRIKPIANMTKDKQEKFDNLIDKFFSDPKEEDNAYSRALIREKKSNGFDLKEALNPKEDLAEIMKDFDFFENSNKNKGN